MADGRFEIMIMVSTKERATQVTLRTLLGNGASFRTAASLLGLSKTTLHRWADDLELARRSWPLPPETIAAVVQDLFESTRSLRAIARERGVSKDTVSRLREQIVSADLEFRPKRVQRPVICAAGHRTMFEPCVECRARNASTGPSQGMAYE
ncbi:hypothetical protein [Anatilimnocola floriformis]|uniref:hypothetical protein n=1 Tax=Anatilimnocola floriformis TaxID=2948575 RepID=UPI0020C50A37|nr:hypothetical protein [Anatilimnocola floriformis]